MQIETDVDIVLGSFLPVTLEQMARERGVLRSDGLTSCISTPHSRNATSSLLLSRSNGNQNSTQCIIHLLGAEVNTSSFALYTFSVAVLVQALTLVSISAVADYGKIHLPPYNIS
jgi:MFS transporter, UMF1 family